MEAFLLNLFSYPTVFFTVLLLLVMVYWLLAILGMLEIEVLDFGPELADATDLEGLGGLMVTLGLKGVPVTVVVSMLLLYSWLICSLAVNYFFFWELSGWWNFLVGSGLIFLSAALALPLTAWSIRPLRPLFRKAYSSPVHKVLLGQTCVVRSGNVNDTFGEATTVVDGASLILKVRARPDLGIVRGDRVVIVDYIPAKNTYIVIPEAAFGAGAA